MYKVGDKVVYPVHGAGQVVAIESREVAGKQRDYYILDMPFSGLRLAVPQSEAKRLGLRHLMNGKQAEQVLAILAGDTVEAALPEKWNLRGKLLAEKIKAGDVCELAAVVCNLARRDNAHLLASGERRLFEQARDILLSELKLLDIVDDDGVGRRLGQAVARLEEKDSNLSAK